MPPQLSWLPDGDPQQTIAATTAMRSLARAGEMSPTVRQTAAFLVAGMGRDQLVHAENLAGWVTMHTRFLTDPYHFEAFTSADDTLALIARDGIATVDCDDVAILAAALGLSIGLRARFVVVSFFTPDAPYEHIWTELSDADGLDWIPVDPARPAAGLPPVVRAPMIVEV